MPLEPTTAQEQDIVLASNNDHNDDDEDDEDDDDDDDDDEDDEDDFDIGGKPFQFTQSDSDDDGGDGAAMDPGPPPDAEDRILAVVDAIDAINGDVCYAEVRPHSFTRSLPALISLRRLPAESGSGKRFAAL